MRYNLSRSFATGLTIEKKMKYLIPVLSILCSFSAFASGDLSQDRHLQKLFQHGKIMCDQMVSSRSSARFTFGYVYDPSSKQYTLELAFPNEDSGDYVGIQVERLGLANAQPTELVPNKAPNSVIDFKIALETRQGTTYWFESDLTSETLAHADYLTYAEVGYNDSPPYQNHRLSVSVICKFGDPGEYLF